MANEPKPLFSKADEDRAAKIKAIEEVKAQVEFETMNQKAKNPKPLSFPDRPIIPPHLTAGKPIDFGNTPTIQTKHTPNPGAVFADAARPNSIIVEAVKQARAKFANLGTSLDSVERQIKQLLPLTVTNVIQWGEPGVSQEADLITKAAALVRMFSELRGNEICEKALSASSQVNTGFFQKLINTQQSVLAYKPNLQSLKMNIMSILPQCDEYIDKIQKAHLRVSINMAALSSVCDAVGTINDSSLSVAVDNRRRILAQCVMQCDLTVQQLQQAKTLMVEQLSHASQLLEVTIPAFESAQSVR